MIGYKSRVIKYLKKKCICMKYLVLSSVSRVREFGENFHFSLLGKVVNVQIASDFVFIPKGE